MVKKEKYLCKLFMAWGLFYDLHFQVNFLFIYFVCQVKVENLSLYERYFTLVKIKICIIQMNKHKTYNSLKEKV